MHMGPPRLSPAPVPSVLHSLEPSDLRSYRHAWSPHCQVVAREPYSIQSRLARRPMRCQRPGKPRAAATGSNCSGSNTDHGRDFPPRRYNGRSEPSLSLRLSDMGPGVSGGRGAGAAQGSAVEDPEQYMTRKPDDSEPFSALAFKVMSDKFVGTLTFCRVYRCPRQTVSCRPARSCGTTDDTLLRSTNVVHKTEGAVYSHAIWSNQLFTQFHSAHGNVITLCKPCGCIFPN